ncbi:Phosphomethylpyrimidine kinase [Scheffersomyces coipomensis]|uniref:Phosphomethylpyrimidine kinase n=1 Tax=Scheffersomyces coipomensis TaxID=1788519 RepID=UPI00315D8982
MSSVKNIKIKSSKVLLKAELPAVLTIAGSDSSGGAGIEADLKTFTAHNVYGLTCITALTAQNTQLVKTFEKTPQSLIESILELNFQDFLYGYEKDDQPLKVVKTGMLTTETVRVLAGYLGEFKKYNVRLVLDPVMVSTSGSSLFKVEDLEFCASNLFKDAYLITPNFVEATTLLKVLDGAEIKEIESLEDLFEFVKKLQNVLGCENLLVKGGHLPWSTKSNLPLKQVIKGEEEDVVIRDVLYESKSDSLTVFESAFINTSDTHGTGCTLASSISANLAKGERLNNAITLSIDYIHKGITSMGRKLGYGNGPLNHMSTPETNVHSVIVADSVPLKHTNVLDFFKEHPKVRDNWKAYIEHDFVNQVANNKLPFNRFLYFLKQDYYYLINYAQIHALAASVAPTYGQTHSEAVIIGEVINEIERHKEKLCKEYNIDYERDRDLDIELQPGKACLDYCDYLLKIGKSENFLGIKVALAPCLHGYAEAGIYGKSIKQHDTTDSETSKVYESWLNDYSSDWYLNAHSEGQKALNILFEDQHIDEERIDELVDIFNTVTKLEVSFWDEVLK